MPLNPLPVGRFGAPGSSGSTTEPRRQTLPSWSGSAEWKTCAVNRYDDRFFVRAILPDRRLVFGECRCIRTTILGMSKMDIFISWSGPRSRAVAEALKKYLPMIVNDFNPWHSSSDIGKGSRSSEEIARALTNAKAGIICLTPNNLKEPWILFEAGAIAKTVQDKPLACTLLLGDLQITDVSGPLAQFHRL